MGPTRNENEAEFDVEGTKALIYDQGSPVAVLITHPWGPLGGSVNNNVVNAVAKYFQQLNVTTARIAFKGSQLGRGLKEVEEVQTVANFMIDGKHLRTDGTSSSLGATPSSSTSTSGDSDRSPTGVILVGYSYGALIAGSASASIRQCIGFAAIAPPFGVKHWLLLFNSEYHMERAKVRRFPRLLLQGSKDNFTSEKKFALAVESFPKGTTGAVLKNADHHFLGREKDVMNIVGQWLVRAYPALRGNMKHLSQVDLWTSSLMEVSDDNSIAAQSFMSNMSRDLGAFSIMSRLYECADTNPCRSTQI